MVGAFARGYARYLSGQGAAGELPDATAAARQTALGAGRPRHARVSVISVAPAAGVAWVLVMRDGVHRLDAQVTVARPASGWIVNTLTPPDLSTALQPVVKRTGPKVPAGGAAPLRVARAFLRVYTRLTRSSVGQLRGLVTPALLAQLTRDAPPSAGPAAARVLAIPIRARGVSWVATPSMSSENHTYQLTITLIKGGARWLVESVTVQP